MEPVPPEVSSLEQQIALAMLAHSARDDIQAVVDSLKLLAELARNLRPIGVIAALLAEFQQGMDPRGRDQLAGIFSVQAVALAANEPHE